MEKLHISKRIQAETVVKDINESFIMVNVLLHNCDEPVSTKAMLIYAIGVLTSRLSDLCEEV